MTTTERPALHLHRLPDDVLVLVMQRLAVDDLLACRLVCKRLGGLALQPDAWRHRRLDDDKPCVCAVLGLAPCLDKAVYSKKVHTTAFMTTRCAVRHLTLIIKKGTECARACLAVRNQEALGRLRNVELEVWRSPEDVAPLDDADALLRTLVALSPGLESLDLLNGLPTPYAMRPVLHGPCRPSLRYFRCALSQRYENFVNTVLAGHAATLQEVHLGHDHCEESTLELLVGMSELRALTCRLCPGMRALASCEMLRDVSFSMFRKDTPETVVQVKGLADFFRQAGQLRTVSIEFRYGDFDFENFDDLMAALASSGESLVHQLSVVNLPYAAPLLSALPRLPALRVLGVLNSPLIDFDLDVDTVDELLVGLTAPSLRRLELSTLDTDGCLHEWLHRDEVARVLTANPSLHVHVWGTHGCRRWERCEECALGCHREVTGDYRKGRRVGLFSHGPGKCTHPEDHITGDKWTWIHIRCVSG
ncbi:uncharacterized protein LOC113210161 [Frankliniella occidentalis]|uniref:Uncharacterized protein LOC113210161 n=1 Tax=Frankliniella occidentalis TaxID=133901 RepID=A0A6J1SR91_FRAOC|nr:uncharacterized protein LOC113210161 [Frankliniella occidentalis]XP_026283805.1 uncharacterized protein LOC113210161 [Frankliniella occidentalis]